MQGAHAYLSRLSRGWIIVVCWILVGLLALIDLATGIEWSLMLFYLIPVFIATWYVDTLFGAVLTGGLAVIWFAEALLYQLPTSTPMMIFWNNTLQLLFFWLVIRLVGMLHQTLQRERMLARTDPLTGAVNWRAFQEIATAEIERARRYQHYLTVAYFDLDDFKDINDRLGHSVGDAVLRTVVDHMRLSLRTNDTVARLGGDEFVVLLPETNVEAAQASLNRIHERLSVTMQEQQWPVTFSGGAVTYQCPPETVDALLQGADQLMYEVKESGKDRIAIKTETARDDSLNSTEPPAAAVRSL